MTAFTQWYDDVLIAAPRCTPLLALQKIKLAAIEFCHESRAYRWEHAAVNVVNGVHTYNYAPPAGYVVRELLSAWYEDVELTMQGSDELELVASNWLTWTGPRPIYATGLNEQGVRLVPAPTKDVTAGLRMLVALKPTQAATDIADRFYEEYREQIARGALAKIYAIPGQPYSSAPEARRLERAFRQDCTDAFNRAAQGFVRAYNITMRLRDE
jgi:hypothetical protein